MELFQLLVPSTLSHLQARFNLVFQPIDGGFQRSMAFDLDIAQDCRGRSLSVLCALMYATTTVSGLTSGSNDTQEKP